MIKTEVICPICDSIASEFAYYDAEGEFTYDDAESCRVECYKPHYNYFNGSLCIYYAYLNKDNKIEKECIVLSGNDDNKILFERVIDKEGNAQVALIVFNDPKYNIIHLNNETSFQNIDNLKAILSLI